MVGLRTERSAQTGYADNPLDRCAASRSDAAAIAAFAQDGAARFVVISGDVPLLRRTGNGLDPLFDRAMAESFGQLREEAFLGVDSSGPVFAVELDQPAAESEQDTDGIVRIDLRTLAVQGLLQAEFPMVAFTTGHGEGDPEQFGPSGCSRLGLLVREQQG